MLVWCIRSKCSWPRTRPLSKANVRVFVLPVHAPHTLTLRLTTHTSHTSCSPHLSLQAHDCQTSCMNDDSCQCVYIGRNADGSAFCGTSPSTEFRYEPCGDQPSYERFTNGEFRKQSVRLLPILLDLAIPWFPKPWAQRRFASSYLCNGCTWF